jgi:DNA-binding MarR family transcriptional regulator
MRSRVTGESRSGSKAGSAPSKPSKRRGRQLNDRDYERLLELRTGLRRFLRWSEGQARAAHLTPVQHQLLLAVRGHPDRRGPTIGEVAGYLVLQHHSVVGLVDRATSAGLVTRAPDAERPGTVRVRLTALGAERLQALSKLHLQELSRLAPTMEALWHGLAERDAEDH